MKKIIHTSLILVLFLLPSASGAGPTLPARIGGSVTIDNITLTQDTDTGYTIKITRMDGTDFSPSAEDKDGLNKSGKYIINIPIYDHNDQPGGAKSGDKAAIHVYKNGVELKVSKPANGEITIGNRGTITQIDLFVSTVLPSAKKTNNHLICLRSFEFRQGRQ